MELPILLRSACARPLQPERGTRARYCERSPRASDVYLGKSKHRILANMFWKRPLDGTRLSRGKPNLKYFQWCRLPWNQPLGTNMVKKENAWKGLMSHDGFEQGSANFPVKGQIINTETWQASRCHGGSPSLLLKQEGRRHGRRWKMSVRVPGGPYLQNQTAGSAGPRVAFANLGF